MLSVLKRLVKDENGAAAIEYALIASVIGLGIVASLGVVATNLGSVFTNVGNAL